jgi:hypothetical protein
MRARRALRGLVTAAALAASLAIAAPLPAHASSGSVAASSSPTALQLPAGATGAFSPLPPTRIVDTRLGQGAPAGKVAPGGTIRFQVAGVSGVPSGASAVALNLTLVDASRPGFASLWSTPAGTSPPAGNPTTSSVNVGSVGATVANMSVIALSTDGTLNLFSDAGGYAVVDLAGYWMPATQAAAGRYNAVTPFRTLDTRGNARLSAEGTIEATVTGVAGIPADAAAVAVTITGTGSAQAGFVTAWPSGIPRPTASTLNLPDAGSTVPNLAIVPVGVGGRISLYSSGGTDVIVDITGWFTGVSAPFSSDGLFVPLPVTRTIDSRSYLGMRRLSPDLSSEMPAAGLAGVPRTGVAAVALNLTVTGTLDDGFLTASPAGVGVPNASNLNFRRGQDVAGLSFAGLGANGKVNVNSVSATNIIADVAGYFTGTPIADQGVHPMACENMMQFNPRNGGLIVRDRTGRRQDIVMDVGGDGQIVGNCDFVAVVRYSVGAIPRIDRYSLGGRLMATITPGSAYLYLTWSPDGRFFFTAEERSPLSNVNARYVYQTDVYTGERKLVFDGKDYVIRAIENFGPTGRLLHITTASATKPFASFVEHFLDVDTGEIKVVTTSGVNPHRFALSPNGLLLTDAEVFPSGFSGPISTCLIPVPSQTCTQVIGFWSTYTPQNELFVEFYSGQAMTYDLVRPDGSFQNDIGKPFPVDASSSYTYFPTYALV